MQLVCAGFIDPPKRFAAEIATHIWLKIGCLGAVSGLGGCPWRSK